MLYFFGKEGKLLMENILSLKETFDSPDSGVPNYGYLVATMFFALTYVIISFTKNNIADKAVKI